MESETPNPTITASRRTWILRARRRGFGDFDDVRVVAASALQAEAILRRQGFEVEDASTRVADGPQHDRRVLWTPPGTLVCGRCGYDLDGLIVRHAAIERPECGYAQVVLAYSPNAGLTREEQAAGIPPWRPSAHFAAGCLSSVLLLILLIIILLSNLSGL